MAGLSTRHREALSKKATIWPKCSAFRIVRSLYLVVSYRFERLPKLSSKPDISERTRNIGEFILQQPM